MAWRISDIPDQTGRRAVVTGATDGLGLQTALALVSKGARVVLCGRDQRKGEAALARVRETRPGADVALELANLDDLAAVRGLAQRLASEPVHLLVNNAGVMGVNPRAATRDGFERQLAVNYLSHFLLTGLLLGALRAAGSARVISLSSLVHLVGVIAFDDLQLERSYTPMRAYAQSKLATLMFAGELQRRSDTHGWGLISAAAHPGGSRTNLLTSVAGSDGRPLPGGKLAISLARLLMQSAAEGALPTLFAATAPEVEPGGYYGPGGLFEIKGPPASARRSKAACDTAATARLWEVSQSLTGDPFGPGA